MSLESFGLARRLYNPDLAVPFRLPSPAVELRPQVGTFEVAGGGEGVLHLHRYRIGELGVSADARRTFEAHADALWVVQASAEAAGLDGVGSASPFDPPTVLRLGCELPIRVAESAL